MWDTFWQAFSELFISEFVPLFTVGVIRGFYIFIVGLAVVYVFGRMLGFLKTYRQKNLVGLVVMLLMAYWVLYVFGPEVDMVFDYLLLLSFSVMWYVLLGFRLYDRADKFIDKRIDKI